MTWQVSSLETLECISLSAKGFCVSLFLRGSWTWSLTVEGNLLSQFVSCSPSTWLHRASLYLIQLLGPREMLLSVYLVFNVSISFWKSICMSIGVTEIFRAIICSICPKSYCLAFPLLGFFFSHAFPNLKEGKWEGLQNYTPRFPFYCE